MNASSLIEAARRRNAEKRGGNEVIITFDESRHQVMPCGKELLALDAALAALAQMHPRQAMLIESRFFGGLEMVEIAALLDVSEATVVRDWRAAKAWLSRELRQAS